MRKHALSLHHISFIVSTQESERPMKRTRLDPSTLPICHKHIPPPNDAAIAAHAQIHRCSSRRMLREITADVPTTTLPAFDLAYLDLFGDTAENSSRHSHAIWPYLNAGMSEQDILESVQTAFRLASAILAHPAQLPFWRGLVRAGRAVDGTARCNDVPRRFTTYRALNAAREAETLAFLAKLGKGTRNSFEDVECDYGAIWPAPSHDRSS